MFSFELVARQASPWNDWRPPADTGSFSGQIKATVPPQASKNLPKHHLLGLPLAALDIAEKCRRVAINY